MQAPSNPEQAYEFVNEPVATEWYDFVFPVLILLVFLWLIRFVRRASSQTTTAIDVTKDGIEISRETVELQRRAIDLAEETIAVQKETNRLLTELNGKLDPRSR